MVAPVMKKLGLLTSTERSRVKSRDPSFWVEEPAFLFERVVFHLIIWVVIKNQISGKAFIFETRGWFCLFKVIQSGIQQHHIPSPVSVGYVVI